MGFPVSIEGTISLKEYSTTPAAAAAQIQEMLEAAQASEVSVRGTEVRFSVKLLRPVSNWNILVSFDSGTFTIGAESDGLVVRYWLSTRRFLRFATAMLGIFGAFIAIALCVSAVFGTWAEPQDVVDVVISTVPLLAVIWLWIVGLNYLVAKMRTPFWLRRELLR